MAKGSYKPKEASYYFRETTPEQEWTISKFLGQKGGDSDTPEVVYTLKCDKPGKRIWCDCPASWGGRDGVKRACKHLEWLQRWKKVVNDPTKVKPGMPIYYNSADDRFYPIPGLAQEIDLA
jgi:hypothetical protein